MLDRIANHFVNYLFDYYQGTLHVRRVATWIGLILKGIERAGAENIRLNRARQLLFNYRNRLFKARYNHQVGSRGGIEILEVLRGRGAPDGEIIFQIVNLQDAEEAYLSLQSGLDRLIDR